MSIRNAPVRSLAALQISSPSDIPARIASIIAHHDAPPLYARHWMTFSSNTSVTPPFRVMQFNVLAEGLSARPGDTPPFLNTPSGDSVSPSSCGGFDFDPTSRGELVFDFHEYRKWRLLEEIMRVDPDVLALEEVDHFADFFEPLLACLGYKGIYQPKKESPSIGFGYYSDGVAVFWREAVFSDAELAAVVGDESSPGVAVVVPLQHRASGKIIVFAATHLKSKASEQNEVRREGQVSVVLDMMSDCSARCGAHSMMLLGDFNTDAFSVPGLQARVVPLVLSWREACLSNAYPLPTDVSCDEYTTWKMRSGKTFKHMIDYMFYTHSSLRVCALLGPPASAEISESRFKLPDLRYPSDHLCIAADITWSSSASAS